jgi:hypothetical protein
MPTTNPCPWSLQFSIITNIVPPFWQLLQHHHAIKHCILDAWVNKEPTDILNSRSLVKHICFPNPYVKSTNVMQFIYQCDIYASLSCNHWNTSRICPPKYNFFTITFLAMYEHHILNFFARLKYIWLSWNLI